MNKLKELTLNYKKIGKKAFVACLTAGYPDINSTLELSKVLVDNGADIIELCIPFSDPVADGPTIQYSSEIALKKGANLKKIFVLADKIRKAVDVPLVFMSYLNPIYNMGLEKAFGMLKGRADGLIIPDTIPEESSKFENLANKNEVSLIPLVAPNTPEARLRYIDSKASSFSYIVSTAGVTGERKELSSSIKEYLLLTKKNMRSPRYLGFGISKPEHVHQVKPHVDGIIVASAIINIIKESRSIKERNNKVSGFVRSIRKSLDF